MDGLKELKAAVNYWFTALLGNKIQPRRILNQFHSETRPGKSRQNFRWQHFQKHLQLNPFSSWLCVAEPSSWNQFAKTQSVKPFISMDISTLLYIGNTCLEQLPTKRIMLFLLCISKHCCAFPSYYVLFSVGLIAYNDFHSKARTCF